MRIEEADQARTPVLTKSDGAVAVVAVGAVAGATYLGLNTKTNVAAILAFTAAIFVALLTAYWTQRRLSQELIAARARLAEQLTAETERQAQQLDAERKRLELQLGSEERRHREELAFRRAETDSRGITRHPRCLGGAPL
jgi:C4-dicarboxylate-specific signal transduction histidine kinase